MAFTNNETMFYPKTNCTLPVTFFLILRAEPKQPDLDQIGLAPLKQDPSPTAGSWTTWHLQTMLAAPRPYPMVARQLLPAQKRLESLERGGAPMPSPVLHCRKHETAAAINHSRGPGRRSNQMLVAEPKRMYLAYTSN